MTSSRNVWATLNRFRQLKEGLGGTMGAETNGRNREGGRRAKRITNISNILLGMAKWQGWDSGAFQWGHPVMFCFIKLNNF